jgi:hypothetical protein
VQDRRALALKASHCQTGSTSGTLLFVSLSLVKNGAMIFTEVLWLFPPNYQTDT